MYSHAATPPMPWLSVPIAKAKNPSLGFPWEDLPTLDTAKDDPVLQAALAAWPGGSGSEQEPSQRPHS